MKQKIKIPEKAIEKSILSFLKINRILAWKNESVGIYDPKKKVYRKKRGVHRKVGVSDILGIYKGRMLAIEVKSPTGRPTQAQLEFLEEVKAHGGIGFVARSIEDVQSYLGL